MLRRKEEFSSPAKGKVYVLAEKFLREKQEHFPAATLRSTTI